MNPKLLLPTLLFIFSAQCWAQPGALYPAFGQSGIVVSTDQPSAFRNILPLANGKFLVTGNETAVRRYPNGATESYTFSIFWRYNANGTLDQTFGRNGKKEFFVTDDYHQYFTSFAILTDGRIVATESVQTVGSNPTPLNRIWRFNSDGTSGVVIAELSVFGYFSVNLNAITADKNNRIVVTGYVRPKSYNEKTRSYIARLLSDGQLDPTFNNVGYRVLVENSSYNYSGEQIVTDPNNNIIIGEEGFYSAGLGFYISKLLENGFIETNFGHVKTSTVVRSLLTDGNSKIIFLAGGNIKRLNINGTPDITFQSSGFSPKTLIAQPNNKIIAIGNGSINGRTVFKISRFATEGTFDQAFGTSGSITTDLNLAASAEDAIYHNKRLYLSGYIVNQYLYGTIVAYDASDVLLNCVTNKSVSVNAGNCSATITGINPIFSSPPSRDRTIPFPPDPYASVKYSKEHNGIVQTGTGSLSGSTFNLGTTHVTYTLTDVTTQTCSFDVTVYDGDPPVARCKNITIQLNESGNATISPAAVNNGSTDGCGIKSMFLSKTTFNCSNIGANTVTLTVVDNSNNQSSCTAIVTVESVTPKSPIHFAVTFSQPPTFTSADISFAGSTAPGALLATVSGGPTVYDVAVSGMAGEGIIVLSIPGAEVGNPASVCPSIVSFRHDLLGPALTINQAAGQPEPTSSSPIHFTATFSQPVTNFDGSHISFTGSTAGGILSATVSGGPTVFDVAVTGMTTPGSVAASILPGVMQVFFLGFYNQGSTSTDNAVIYDPSIQPTVIINQAPSQADPTFASPNHFTVTFSLPVSGFTASDISFAGSTAPGTLTATVTGGPIVYNVAVRGMTAPGNVVASIPEGIAFTTSGATNLTSTSTDNTVTFNVAASGPSVTINQSAGQLDPVATSPVHFTAIFSQGVFGFDASDISFAGSTAPGNLVAQVQQDFFNTGTYEISVSGMTGPGTVVTSIPPGVASGLGTNKLSTSTDNSVSYDPFIPPTVTVNQAITQADPTNNSPLHFTLTFSQPVSGFTGSDISFTGSTAPGSLVAIVSGGPVLYTVAVRGMIGPGTVIINVPAGGAANMSGVYNLASTSTDNNVTFNVIASGPTVTIDQSANQFDPTANSPINFTVRFSDWTFGLDASDISFAGSTAPGNFVAQVQQDFSEMGVYNVSVSGMTGPGNVVASVPPGVANAFITGTNKLSTSTDNSVAYDPFIPPTVTINQAATQADPTFNSPINFTVTYSQPVSGFTGSDISFTGSTAPGSLVAIVTGGPIVYNVAVRGMTSQGTVMVNIPAGAAANMSGVANLASSSNDNTVIFNVAESGPSVTINQSAGQVDPAATSPINFTVTFSDWVLDFDASDISFAGSTAPGNLVAQVQQVDFLNRIYNVSVSGMTGPGTVVASVPPGVANSFLLGTNRLSTSTDNIVSYGLFLPTVTINQAGSQTDPTTVSIVHFTVTFSEAVTGFTGTDISFTGTTAPGSLIATVTGGPIVYDVAVTGMTGSGLVIASVPAGTVVNASLGGNFASTSIDNTVTFNYCVPPQIIAAPIAVQAAECSNSIVNFFVSASGTNLHYQWKLDGANTFSYNVSNLAAGVHTVTVDVTNSCGSDVAATTISINADDTPPLVTGCPSDLTFSLAANACTKTATWIEPTATDNCSAGNLTYFSRSHAPGAAFAVGITTVIYVFKDVQGNESMCSFDITVQDITVPVISNTSVSRAILSPPNRQMVPITIEYDLSDNCGATATLTVSSNEPISGTSKADRSPDWIITDNHHVQLRAEQDPNGSGRVYTITITATDASGNISTATQRVVMALNIKAPVSGAVVRIGSTINLSGTFWDVAGNKHTGKWLMDDNTSVSGTVIEPSGMRNGTVTGSYKFTSPGVYKLQMNVTNQKGITSYVNTNGDLEAIVVVYDPNGGYTYGGGSFHSPAGALKSNPAATGDVGYGFTINYYKNATLPKGETQLNFKLGDFEFNALNFDYLVINKATAQFKGTGKIIGGQSGIGFTMTVTDGQIDGSGTDKIGMKIYNKNNGQVYYENQPGVSEAALPVQAVGTNSTIVISGSNSITTTTSQKTGIEESAISALIDFDVNVYPNPGGSIFNLQITGDDNLPADVKLINDLGQIIKRIKITGNTLRFGNDLKAGIYIVEVVQGTNKKAIKLVKF